MCFKCSVIVHWYFKSLLFENGCLLFLYVNCFILKEDRAFILRIVQNDLKHYLQLPLSSYNQSLTFVSKVLPMPDFMEKYDMWTHRNNISYMYVPYLLCMYFASLNFLQYFLFCPQ